MKAKKTSISKLAHIPKLRWEGRFSIDLAQHAIYSHVAEDSLYEFIFAPKPQSKRLIVFFSGDARRTLFDPPVFQRWSWARKFPASCIYFSDPALHLRGDLGLGWYAGSAESDYLRGIWDIVNDFS
uniref:hypothetical protein n=1 Tax=Nesterenkonia massiliensis TaxID=1232429 RepID=UPI001C9C4959